MAKLIDSLILNIDENAFNKSTERTGLRATKRFTRRVAEMNRAVEVLDKDDEFAMLSLLASVYKESGEYGIKRIAEHQGDDRILPRQVRAATMFLRDLRGFGLLADVVGSGKTYEACTVLSELAAKGKISTVLVIVPAQMFNTWKFVLEMQFGLGKGVLCTAGPSLDGSLFERKSDGLLHPKQPMIVTTEDFVRWQENMVKGILFDAVLVDEAHMLCGEEGSSAKAMKLLSILMQTKRESKSYCIMLSATPHSGNLENMFRLWYFVRCKGGDPTDFDEKDDNARTETYREEKEYYKNHVCRGATTVKEFIEVVKMTELITTHEKKFFLFAKDKGAPNVAKFKALLPGEKKRIIDEFFANRDNLPVIEKVKEAIASAYHEGVLRSIMIRLPHEHHTSKRIENVFFFPAKCKDKIVSCNGIVPGTKIKVNVERLDKNDAITTEDGSFSVAKYVEENKGNSSYNHAFAELFFNNGIFAAMGVKDKNSANAKGDFRKVDSLRYYWEQLESFNVTDSRNSDGIGVTFRPIFDGKDAIEAKIAELKAILRRYSGERAIVFFDYDAPRKDRCWDKVVEALKADPDFAPHLMIGDDKNKKTAEAEFNKREDAILVVTDTAFTEGVNLQTCRVLINFQVTPNPLSLEQRIGRIFRTGQNKDVIIYSLADMRELEGYVLMYYSAIGLLTSNDGDAAIIAGSNNDNMVTIRCNGCGKVKLLSRDDYDAYKKNDSDAIYCDSSSVCTQGSSRGMMMEEINSYEFKCTSCGQVIKRERDNRYYCFTHNSTGRGVLCNSGAKGDRELYCKKICVISHCSQFTSGKLAGKCPAIDAYNKNHNVSDAELLEICDSCPHAESGACPSRCRLTYAKGVEAISPCVGCSTSHNCHNPGPHVITFEADKWVAECPRCKEENARVGRINNGMLVPVVAKTFETYIRGSFDYEQDGGESFCPNLLFETKKVSLIKEILSSDKMRRQR